MLYWGGIGGFAVPDAYVFRRKKKVRLLPVVLVAVVGLGLLAAAVLYAFGFFRATTGDAPAFDAALPGSRTSAAGGLSTTSYATLAADAWKTSQALLGKNGFLLSEALLASKDGTLPFETSDTMSASDQLLRLQHELEQDRRSSFLSLQKAFASVFVESDGLVRPSDSGTQSVSSPADSLLYARLLAEGYAHWHDARLLAACRATSDALLATLDAQGLLAPDRTAVLPSPAPSPTDETFLTPTPGPTSTPLPTPTPRPLDTVAALGLSQADFEAMRQLSLLDGRWKAVYAANLAVVQGGLLGDDLPLYAEAYSTASGGYLPFTGEHAWVDTLESLRVVLHLCEVGQADPRSLAWLRTQVMDTGAVYAAYDLATGSPVSTDECVPAYAIAARIARMTGDAVYYKAAIDRIDWNLATDVNSLADGAVFRKDATGRVLVFAVDNLWAMLALE